LKFSLVQFSSVSVQF